MSKKPETEQPSWLTENNIKAMSSAATNPMVQESVSQSFMKIATDPKALSDTLAGLAIVKNVSAKHSAVPDVESGSVDESKSTLNIDEAELEQIENWAKKLRMGYLVTSVLMSLAAFFQLGTNNLGVLFLALYVWFFALLIFCFELALTVVSRLIAQNFGFLYNPISRCLFLFFVMMMCYELGLIGKIVMAMLAVIGSVNIYVVIKHPQYEEYLRRQHYFKGEHGPVVAS